MASSASVSGLGGSVPWDDSDEAGRPLPSRAERCASGSAGYIPAPKLTGVSALAHDPIVYDVDLSDRLHHLVRVSMRIPADLADDARIVMPAWTPGSYVIRDYVHHVQWIEASDASGSPVTLDADGPGAWRLTGNASGPADVNLELYANDLSVRTNHVDDHHALLVAAATFPYVDAAREREHVVRVRPSPPSHRVWSLLPSDDHETFRADDLDHLIDSAFEVGQLPSVDYEVSGVPHTFVWAGHGPAPDLDAVARAAAAIGDVAVALFEGELPIERYTVLCTAWDRGGGGLEHRDGAVLQVPVRTFADPDLTARFHSLVAHEYLHLWNAKRLVPAELVRPDFERPTPTASLWVAEGWTSYYDELVPLRAGVWEPRRFLDHLGDTMRRVRDTPGHRFQGLRQASREAWVKHYVRDENSPNAGIDYYSHGAMVAFELDLRLRAQNPGGDGLDDVLRHLWRRHATAPAGYTEDDVLAAIAHVGGDDLAALIDGRVARPNLPDIDSRLLASVGLAETPTHDPPLPDLGVEIVEDERGVMLATVLRHRPAWRAGLTGGDRIIAIDGTTVGPGEVQGALRLRRPGVTIEVTVVRGPRVLTRNVTLGPARPATRLVAVPDADDRARGNFLRWTGHDLDALQ